MATASFVHLLIESTASLGWWLVDAFLRAELLPTAVIPHPARVS
jgi:hypothetical protein